jgi:hypothetical protein
LVSKLQPFPLAATLQVEADKNNFDVFVIPSRKAQGELSPIILLENNNDHHHADMPVGSRTATVILESPVDLSASVNLYTPKCGSHRCAHNTDVRIPCADGNVSSSRYEQSGSVSHWKLLIIKPGCPCVRATPGSTLCSNCCSFNAMLCTLA